ncbi:MAG: hypothetical protein R3E39_24410 [Anaerolineae bacterium]
MSTNKEWIKEQIRSFDAKSVSDTTETPPSTDSRSEAFLATILAKVAALDAEQQEKWAANAPKLSRHKANSTSATPDWYGTESIKEAKTDDKPSKKRTSQHPYPGRRLNKRKAN